MCKLLAYIVGIMTCFPNAKYNVPAHFSGLNEKEISEQFVATSAYLDAALNSVNALGSVIKKENYRNKITSLNNPTSSDMGFNLENEIQTALKPLLAKAKNVNVTKFSQVVNSLVSMPTRPTGTYLTPSSPPINPLFTTLLSLVGNLAINEKKITRDDLDSFINSTSKYFVQYEKLNQANNLFDQHMDRLNSKFQELQFDLKEYILDLVSILYRNVQRNVLKSVSAEDIYLRYLDQDKLKKHFENSSLSIVYPTDGIKTAKEVAGNLQKLFADYQKVYSDNYQQIKMILTASKTLGKGVDVKQVEASLADLTRYYEESKNFDTLALRINTLLERLKILAASEQDAGQNR